MRKLIVSTFASLDGVMQAPGGPEEDPTDGFTLGGWMASFADAGMDLSTAGFDGKDRELVLGRRTYEIFAAYWPYQPDCHPLAKTFNAARKYVASRTLTTLSWNNSTLLPGNVVSAITALKTQPGPDLQIIGSSHLIQTLQPASLIDEYNLWTFPVVLGRGKRLFGETARPFALRLLHSQVSATGVVMSTYVPDGDIRLDNLQPQRFYHGTRAELKPGDRIQPSHPPDGGEQDSTTPYVYLTPNRDGAIWEAELALGEGSGRVYTVEPIGPIEDTSGLTDYQSPGHPSMSWRSREPLRVTGEVTEWPLYHGTRADLKPGDLIKPGYPPNFGNRDRTTPHVYLTRTLDAAIWGAELAAGEGPGRIYLVEPTGPIEADPNLTNTKFRGNPTQSFRSRAPLRVTGEMTDWQGHSPAAVKAMKEGIARLEQLGVEPIDD